MDTNNNAKSLSLNNRDSWKGGYSYVSVDEDRDELIDTFDEVIQILAINSAMFTSVDVARVLLNEYSLDTEHNRVRDLCRNTALDIACMIKPYKRTLVRLSTPLNVETFVYHLDYMDPSLYNPNSAMRYIDFIFGVSGNSAVADDDEFYGTDYDDEENKTKSDDSTQSLEMSNEEAVAGLDRLLNILSNNNGNGTPLVQINVLPGGITQNIELKM